MAWLGGFAASALGLTAPIATSAQVVAGNALSPAAQLPAAAALASAPPASAASTAGTPLAVPSGPAQPEKAGPPDDEDVAITGPPTPKARHGTLAPLAWPAAPGVVPEALENAVNIATRNYPTAKAARAAVRAAASDVRAARFLRFPSYSANIVSYDSARSPEPEIVLEAPIWTAGRIGAGIRRARASETASSADYVDTVQSLALTTVQTYFEIVRLTQREQLLADSLREHQRLVDTMDRRVTHEVSPLADLELARSRTAQVAQDYNIAHAQRLTALRVMAQLVADPAYDLGPVPYFDPAITIAAPAVLEGQAAAYSPQLRSLDAQVDVARADYDARRASIFPQLSAQYSYDQFYGHRVGAVVRAQGEGGLTEVAAANAARLRVDAASEDQRAAEEALRRDVASDVIEFQAAKDRATISHTVSETAANVSESYMRQFIAGRRSWLDVMNALREAVNASIGESEAQVAAMSASVRLQLKSGRWRPTFDEPRL